MSRLFHYRDWRLALAGILAGIATLVIVLALFLTTRGGAPARSTALLAPDTAVTDPDAGPVIGAFQADITKMLRATRPPTTPLRGPLHIAIRDITWQEDDGRVFARAAGADADIATGPMVDTDVIMSNVELNDPEIFLRESTPGVWNFQSVFYELLHAPETNEPKRRIHLDGLHIANGYVDVKRPADAFSFRNLEGQIDALSLSDPALSEPAMFLATADAVFERMSSRTRLPIHAEGAKLTFPNGTVTFDVARANIENTRVADVRGIWNPEWPGYAVEAEGDALGFEVADFRSFAPERMPEDGTATFHFRVRPLAGDGTDVALSHLVFKATGASARGDLGFQFFPTRFQLGDVDLQVDELALSLMERVMGRKLPYAGKVAGTLRGPARDITLDMLASLTMPDGQTPFTSRVTGSVAMLESGLSVKQLTANLKEVPLAALKAFMPGLPLTGVVTGTIAVNGAPKTTPVQLDMRLELGTGLATVNGMLDLTGVLPRYDFTGRLIGIDVHTIMKPAVPPVTLGARFALEGTGFKPEEVDARLRIDGGFTGWQSNPGDTIIASVRIRNGGAEVDTLVSTLATASVDAAGRWRFVEPLSGAVHYRAEISSLAPFGPYLPVIGDSVAAGAIEASGDISGSLSRLTLAGVVKAEEAKSGAWSASSLDATYALAFGNAVPEVQLDMTGRGISTPTAGTYEVATARATLAPPGFQVNLNAQRSQSAGAVEFVANGSMPTTGARELFVERAFFDLQEGRWQLARTAHVAWGGDDGVRVDSLFFRNEKTLGEVLIDGRVLPLDRADFTARVAALPIGDVQTLIGRAPIVTGLVWGDARVQPPGDRPDIDVNFRLENGTVQGIPVTHMQGTLGYANERALGRLTIALDTAGTIDVDAAVPVAIRLSGGKKLELLGAGDLSGSIVAQNFSLAPTDSFITMVRNVRGLLNGTVTLGGTVSDPQLNGDLSLSAGNATVPQLNQTYTDIGGTLHFEGRRASLQVVRARSGGTVELGGDITFEKLNEPVFNVSAAFNGFRPIGVDNQDDAAVDGSVRLSGKLDALDVTGNVILRDGYVVIPQFGADITTSYGDLAAASPVLGQDLTPTAGAQWMKNLSVRNMSVRFGDGVWVTAQDARVQLTGTLNVNKIADDITVLGELEGQRGYYTLAAGPIVRRFDITHATVRFLGGSDMNPSIDVDARRIVLNPGARRINVEVHIGGTVRTPTLSLASEDAPNIPQEELLSYLLFGRSTLAVGTDPLGSGGLLGETAVTLFGGVSELLSLELEQRIVGDLGLPLDVFQVSVGLDGTSSLILGRQIADKFFLTFESGLASLGGSNTAGGMNDWALRVEWAIAPQSSVQFGSEPVRTGARIRGLGLQQLGSPRRQGFVELRRRWTW